MLRSIILLPLVVGLTACGGDHREPPADHEQAPAESCKTRSAELASYLAQVVDPNAKPAPPWPIGDAELDKKLTAARDDLRKGMTKDPAAKAHRLSPGFKRGPVDDTLDGCPQARDAWANISNVEGPDHMTKAMTAIGGGVNACACHVNIPLLRAAMYLAVRGPD